MDRTKKTQDTDRVHSKNSEQGIVHSRLELKSRHTITTASAVDCAYKWRHVTWFAIKKMDLPVFMNFSSNVVACNCNSVWTSQATETVAIGRGLRTAGGELLTSDFCSQPITTTAASDLNRSGTIKATAVLVRHKEVSAC